MTDFGDVVHETFRVDAGHGPARNVTATVRAARVVADVVEDAAGDGSVLLVLGGDCTITLGVLAGLQRVAPDAGRVLLSVLFTAPALSAVVLTEVNPSYDPAGDSLDRYIEAVTGALISGLDGPDR